MNFSFIIGSVLCFVVVFVPFLFGQGSHQSFWSIHGAVITLGGTAAAMMASFPFDELSKIPSHLPIILGSKKNDPVRCVKIMTKLCEEAKRRGTLALENMLPQIGDDFLKESITLIIDGADTKSMLSQLENRMDAIEERHNQSFEIYEKAMCFAVRFGLCGTIAGIVKMLGNMNFFEEGGAVFFAQGMALAFVSVFYGFILSYLIFSPALQQLKAAHAKEMVCKRIVARGACAIREGHHPAQIDEMLKGYLTYREKLRLS